MLTWIQSFFGRFLQQTSQACNAADTHQAATHPLEENPDLPKGLMSAIAPAYETLKKQQDLDRTQSDE